MLVQVHFGHLFSSKIVICGHCLVTLCLTVTDTLKWPIPQPILIQNGGDSVGKGTVQPPAPTPPSN